MARAASNMSGLNAREKPPDDLISVFKQLQRIDHREALSDSKIIRRNALSTTVPLPEVIRTIDTARLCFEKNERISNSLAEVPVLEWPDLPGLHFIPGLLSDGIQLELLSRILHRDLANPQHQTNIHKHYEIPYDLAEGKDRHDTDSFFNCSRDSAIPFRPLEPNIHRPLTLSKFLEKKLRWLTLGGQYDWSKKMYPQESPPAFPFDIASLIQQGFPDMVPQAAIVNVYSPGDTLALHRDVSEASDHGIVSISIGCDAIFMAGLSTETGPSKWRSFLLRSGDAIYMSGVSRYAWHGVPKIFENTCPQSIQAWPASPADGRFKEWRNWMARKRINLNVRQMFDEIEM